ncbi:MAG: hypothetical protein IKF09_02605 [Clostridiales bacterium]|nr:hypothetical protein [Clostridiales bacterium]
MAEITKYNVYLSEQQAHKVDLLSMTTGREPEEIINDAVYGYLAIADPFAEDSEPEEGMHEILFEIPDEVAEEIMRTMHLEDYDNLDEYIKAEVVHSFTPRQKTQAELDEEYFSEENNPNLLYDPLDPCVEVDEDGYRI